MSKKSDKSTNKSKLFHPLDEVERDLADFLASDSRAYKPTLGQKFKSVKKLLSQAATNFLTEQEKTKPITIRLSQRDLLILKTKASEASVPYQTLIKSLVSQYTRGRLKLSL